MSIDFSKLTRDDKACAIADFNLENLIMEVFTSQVRVRDRLLISARKLIGQKLNRPLEDIQKYLSLLFTVINESPEE